MYKDADSSSPSRTAVTDCHRFGATSHELDWIKSSFPDSLNPTNGVRPSLQASEVKKYSVSEDSLPMFHKKWYSSTMDSCGFTSICTVAESASAKRSSGNSTQEPSASFSPPERTNPESLHLSEVPLCTWAAPKSESASLVTDV